MTSRESEIKRLRDNERWFRVLSAELRFKFNRVNPPQEAFMEGKEAFIRIRQILMTVCELYDVKEQYWAETESFGDAATKQARDLLERQHHALNESIFQHVQQIEKLTEFLTPDLLLQVNHYIDGIRPYLDKCVPRITGPDCQSTGERNEDPQLWYRAKQPDLPASLTSMYSDIIIKSGE